jgi:hypothetical protein
MRPFVARAAMGRVESEVAIVGCDRSLEQQRSQQN